MVAGKSDRYPMIPPKPSSKDSVACVGELVGESSSAALGVHSVSLSG